MMSVGHEIFTHKLWIWLHSVQEDAGKSGEIPVKHSLTWILFYKLRISFMADKFYHNHLTVLDPHGVRFLISSGWTLTFRAFVTLSPASSVQEYARHGIPCSSKEVLSKYCSNSSCLHLMFWSWETVVSSSFLSKSFWTTSFVSCCCLVWAA